MRVGFVENKLAGAWKEKTLWPEGLRIILTLSEIEPSSSRFIGQCRNQLCYRVPQFIIQNIFIGLCECVNISAKEITQCFKEYKKQAHIPAWSTHTSASTHN